MLEQTYFPDAKQQTSLGKYRVGITFNPSNNTNVDLLKKQQADFIDTCKYLMDQTDNPEAKRCFAEAMTNAETAAMYAVKGATKPALP